VRDGQAIVIGAAQASEAYFDAPSELFYEAIEILGEVTLEQVVALTAFLSQ